MIRIESTVQIGRPRDEVFAFVTDVANLPKWQSGLVKSEPLSQGPVRIGYQFAEVVKAGPWRMEALCTVTDIKVNERFAFQMQSKGPIDCNARFDLQPIVGGTRLTVSGEARLKGLAQLMRPFVAKELRQETRKELAAAKLLLEADAPVAPTVAAI